MTTLDEVQELFPGDEILVLIKNAVKKAESATEVPNEPRHAYDELLEMSIGMRMRLEAGDKKGAIAGLLAKIIDFAVGPSRWSLSSPRTIERVKRFASVAIELGNRNPSLLEGS